MLLPIMILSLGLSQTLELSLARDPLHKPRWEQLLKETPVREKSAVEYLLANMPIYDLKSLAPSKVSEAVHLAFKAKDGVSWGKSLPPSIFMDSVVPYACVTEPRDSMRREFQERYLPQVKTTKTPGEAALLVNKTLFKDYHVQYNTARLRTDQSPPETIAQGMATCTGLSIMLVDALRAVGVPSRLAGIKSWPKTGGNHTWVEVWDQGSWHFVGAAEPDPAGLDHAWFANQAAGAVETNPENAIYAVTYGDGGARFPLEWDPGVTVPAENVTARYQHKTTVASTRLLIDVTAGGQRIKAMVSVKDAVLGSKCAGGESLGSAADLNHFLEIPAIEGRTYEIETNVKGKSFVIRVVASGPTVVHLKLN